MLTSKDLTTLVRAILEEGRTGELNKLLTAANRGELKKAQCEQILGVFANQASQVNNPHALLLDTFVKRHRGHLSPFQFAQIAKSYQAIMQAGGNQSFCLHQLASLLIAGKVKPEDNLIALDGKPDNLSLIDYCLTRAYQLDNTNEEALATLALQVEQKSSKIDLSCYSILPASSEPLTPMESAANVYAIILDKNPDHVRVLTRLAWQLIGERVHLDKISLPQHYRTDGASSVEVGAKLLRHALQVAPTDLIATYYMGWIIQQGKVQAIASDFKDEALLHADVNAQAQYFYALSFGQQQQPAPSMKTPSPAKFQNDVANKDVAANLRKQLRKNRNRAWARSILADMIAKGTVSAHASDFSGDSEEQQLMLQMSPRTQSESVRKRKVKRKVPSTPIPFALSAARGVLSPLAQTSHASSISGSVANTSETSASGSSSYASSSDEYESEDSSTQSSSYEASSDEYSTEETTTSTTNTSSSSYATSDSSELGKSSSGSVSHVTSSSGTSTPSVSTPTNKGSPTMSSYEATPTPAQLAAQARGSLMQQGQEVVESPYKPPKEASPAPDSPK